MRRYNEIAARFASALDDVEPIFWEGARRARSLQQIGQRVSRRLCASTDGVETTDGR